MCFRTLFMGIVVCGPAGGFGPATGDPNPPSIAQIRVVSQEAGVLCVRTTIPPGSMGEIRAVRGDDPVASAPLRPDFVRPEGHSARLMIPGGLPEARRTSVQIELWTDAGEGWQRVEEREIPAVHNPAAAVPGWAQGIVWYQVFPERFRNANPANDPFAWDRTVLSWDAPFHEVSAEEIEMLWDRRLVDPLQFTADPGRWAGGWGALGQVIFQRRYGGDLQGVVAGLDHIASLGATGLYLCPVFDARSLHKYDASDHRHVDPTLGHPDRPEVVDRSLEDPLDESTWGWEPADRYLVDHVLPAARERGMRVILDGVWNHVGRDHFAFRDVLEKGRDSAYADWFKVEFDEDGRVLRYKAWDRTNGALPEFLQTRDGDLAPGPKAHVFAVTRRWMDPNGDGDPSDGIDGWRLDVAAEVGRAFWRDWRAHVRSINPDAVLVGEIWDDAELWFNGVAFDAQMNYPVASAVADWLAIGPQGSDAVGIAARLRRVLNHDPAHEAAQMTLIASHDTERGASLMHNPTPRAFDTGATPWLAGSVYDAGAVNAAAKRRLLTAFALLVALPGSPMIYNGDEFALPGADDPDNRRPIPWPAGEIGNQADEAFAASLGRLLSMRTDARFSDLLRLGSVEVEALDPERLVVRRALNGRVLEMAVARTGDAGFGGAAGMREAIYSGVYALLNEDGDAVLRWRLVDAETGR